MELKGPFALTGLPDTNRKIAGYVHRKKSIKIDHRTLRGRNSSVTTNGFYLIFFFFHRRIVLINKLCCGSARQRFWISEKTVKKRRRSSRIPVWFHMKWIMHEFPNKTCNLDLVGCLYMSNQYIFIRATSVFFFFPPQHSCGSRVGGWSWVFLSEKQKRDGGFFSRGIGEGGLLELRTIWRTLPLVSFGGFSLQRELAIFSSLGFWEKNQKGKLCEFHHISCHIPPLPRTALPTLLLTLSLIKGQHVFQALSPQGELGCTQYFKELHNHCILERRNHSFSPVHKAGDHQLYIWCTSSTECII